MSEQWFMAIGGHQVGPVTAAEIVSNLRNGTVDAATLVFAQGMSGWTPIASVSAFAAHAGGTGPALPALPQRRAHEIGFTIHGEEMQFVEIELDPGESAIAEAGAMMYMTQGIDMETVFGDGSANSASMPGASAQDVQAGVMGALLGAGKRLLTGESLFMTVFTSKGAALERVAFAAPYAGRIITLDLTKLGGQILCQKDSFLCAARGVSVGIAFQKKIGVGLFGGEGFIMQRLEGDGLCFAHAGGTIHAIELKPGETLRCDTGCLVALQPSVSYDIQFVGKIKTALFGGEGIFYATLTGPGKVWLQSLPLSRLADRIYKAAPQRGGSRQEEGSILDHAMGLGRLIDGK